jgi:hypothetical protein
MRPRLVGLATLSALVIALATGQHAAAEKRGRILELGIPASSASVSPLKETTISAEMPIMYDRRMPPNF